MRKALLLLVVLAGIVAGCEDKYKDPDPKAMGYDYYPLEIGAYRIYNVTDIKFKFNKGDTLRFQMRERIDTSFYDQTNALVYKVIRSVRTNENSIWKDDSVMTVSISNNMVQLTRDNTKYVKLVFPIKEGGEWVGDAFNDHFYNDNVVLIRNSKIRDGKELYTYANVGASYDVGEINFPNTVTVIQNSPETYPIRIDERKEVYAEGVGLVYRIYNRVVFEPCADDQCEFGEGYKLDGHERHEELITYGTR
ncbi:hypothetical protein GCM10023188_11220 [Pontibacter saemangeumensis]|uniref:DKNYY family protein n=1 Tax=Pontibacter saemangeumensis TaxID=1084525 RepID=A0ABP8LG60_9BACT